MCLCTSHLPSSRTALDAPLFPGRRSFLAAGASFLLAGCASGGTLDLMSKTLALVGKGEDADYPRTRTEVDALPYAQLGVSRGNGPRGVLVLADVSGEELSWVSGDRVQVVTYRNRVVRTTGLRSDFSRTVLQGPDFWDRYLPAAETARGAELERVVQIEPGEHAPVRMLSRFEIEGEERIEIMGVPVDTLRVREDLDVPHWRWQACNTWWLSRETPLAWRSIQHLTPDQPPLHLEVLKRFA